jgi:hypothetical protein
VFPSRHHGTEAVTSTAPDRRTRKSSCNTSSPACGGKEKSWRRTTPSGSAAQVLWRPSLSTVAVTEFDTSGRSSRFANAGAVSVSPTTRRSGGAAPRVRARNHLGGGSFRRIGECVEQRRGQFRGDNRRVGQNRAHRIGVVGETGDGECRQ